MNKHWGPFTYSLSNSFQPVGLAIFSGDSENNGQDKSHARLHLGKHTIILELGELLRPDRKKIFPSYWTEADKLRMGRDWYFQYTKREYSILVDKTSIWIKYGAAPMGYSSENKSKHYFLPWTQSRHICRRIYDKHNTKVVAEVADDASDTATYMDRFSSAEAVAEKETVGFLVEDYDGKQSRIKAHVEEDVWERGEGWFKWLSLFVKTRIKRRLRFKSEYELGCEKGSYKGGYMGWSIDIQENESPEQALKAWCLKQQGTPEAGRDQRHDLYLTFIRKLGDGPEAFADWEGGDKTQVEIPVSVV